MAPIISSVESTIIYAEDAAKFLSDQSSIIAPRLEEGLAQLGYGGKYAVRCGFNEEFLEEKLHPEVFLFVYKDLKCDEEAISKVISPIFRPHTTIMYTPSQFYYLDPPDNASDLPDSQGSSSSSIPIHPIASDLSIDAQSSDRAGQETSQGQRSGQGSNSGSSDQEQNQHPDKEEIEATSGDEQQPDKKGDAEQNEETPENYHRQLEFELQAFLRMKGQDGQAADVVISQMETKFRVEINNNPEGNNPPDLRSPWTVIDPWTFVEFRDLIVSNAQPCRYALSAIEARIVTTPFEADCLQRHPEPEGPTGCHKVPAEYRGGRKGSLDIDDAITHRESELQNWDPISNNWSDSIKNIRLVRLGYRSNRPGRMTDKPSFNSTLHTILSFPPQTDRTLNIEIKAFWKSTERPDKKSMFSSRLGVRPDELVNFYHKIFFKINLEEIMRGKVTTWLSCPTPKEDFVQRRWGSDEAAFGSVDIEFLPVGKQTTSETSSRPDYRLVMTLHRTVV